MFFYCDQRKIEVILVYCVGLGARFRVVDETFVDTTPSGPESTAETELAEGEKKSPYSLVVSH